MELYVVFNLEQTVNLNEKNNFWIYDKKIYNHMNLKTSFIYKYIMHMIVLILKDPGSFQTWEFMKISYKYNLED